MASTFQWGRDTGAAAGSPAKGTLRTIPVSFVDFKNIDDTTTDPSNASVVAGNNSFDVFMFGKFTGSFTQISNGKFAHTGGTPDTGITINGKVLSTYTTPAVTANANLTVDMTSAISIGSGEAVLFSTTGPEDASPSATLSAAGFSQFFGLQAITTTAMTAGAKTPLTFTMQWDEI